MEKLKSLLKDLNKNGKLDADSVTQIASSLGEIEKEYTDMKSKKEELQDKMVDLVLKTPVSSSPQSPTSDEKEISLEECIQKELNKENK